MRVEEIDLLDIRQAISSLERAQELLTKVSTIPRGRMNQYERRELRADAISQVALAGRFLEEIQVRGCSS